MTRLQKEDSAAVEKHLEMICTLGGEADGVVGAWPPIAAEMPFVHCLVASPVIGKNPHLRETVSRFLQQHHPSSFDIALEMVTLATVHCAKMSVKELTALLQTIDSALRHHLYLSASTVAQQITLSANETRVRQIRALTACSQLIRKAGARANARVSPSFFQLVELLQSFHSSIGAGALGDSIE